MGNSHSQHHQIQTHQWTHSYPRPRHIQPQVKVLPERIPPLRLRTTDNGEILQNGGTLSCRRQGGEERMYRPRSSSAHRPPKPEEITLDKARFGSEPDLRFHLRESRDQFSDNAVRQRISRSRKKYKAPPAPHNGTSSGMESSSPDLAGWEASGKDCNTGPGRKARLFKTRAETNRKNISNLKGEKIDSELSKSTEALNISVASKFSDDKLRRSANEERGKSERTGKKGLKRSASHEVISPKKNLATPEFQAELLEAAQRLKPPFGIHRHKLVVGKPNNAKSHVDIHEKEETLLTRHQVDLSKENSFAADNRIVTSHHPEDTFNRQNTKGENSARCKLENIHTTTLEVGKDKPERDVPSKKFYFGMEDNNNNKKSDEFEATTVCTSKNNVDKTNAEHRMTAVEKSKNFMNLYKSVADRNQEWEDSVDKFAASFHRSQMGNGNATSCSSSFASDPDEDVLGGIALQLRPTLPKKQLEIPRFSPTAAWRLLSSIDPLSPPSPSPGEHDESPFMVEDRINAPASQQAFRNGHDKSGDSGISGDASPGGCHESSSEIAATSPKTMPTQNPKNILMAWTPQQDLEEESSSDDLESPMNSSKNTVSNIPGAKFSPRSQLFLSRDQPFSISIPREDQMCLFNDSPEPKERSLIESTPGLNSLRKLKEALVNSKRTEENAHSQNDNWVLSRSVPGSMINGHVALTRTISNPSSPEQEDEGSRQTSLKYPSYSYLASGGRMMYLPEYHSRTSPDVLAKRPRSGMYSGFLSKSCENIMQPEMKEVARSRTPSPIGARSRKGDPTRLSVDPSRISQTKKKFTFQSTVRMIENRRIAEKLSREAELKENQRLSEVEAMRKVEEEFQKKRAREKANIRHQLRLFSLEEKNYISLPPCDWQDNRPAPDGAPSSLPPVAHKKTNSNKKTSTILEMNKLTPSTQVLSEYREPTRDYRDYRHPRYQDFQELNTTDNCKRSVVEHPRMVYDMPKNTAVYVSAPINLSAHNQYKEDSRAGLATPRSSSSDNYRKDFANGALTSGGKSLTSSDSELSQSHPRTIAHQGIPSRRISGVHRSRSASPESVSSSGSPESGLNFSARSRSSSLVKVVTSRSDSPDKTADPVSVVDTSQQALTISRNHEKQDSPGRNSSNSLLRLGLPSLQPFDKSGKSFRPINFSPVINKLAQTVN